jgi:hypothetical protein
MTEQMWLLRGAVFGRVLRRRVGDIADVGSSPKPAEKGQGGELAVRTLLAVR